MGSRLFLIGLIVAMMGSSDPEKIANEPKKIANPSLESLDGHHGSTVSISGTPWVEKEGEVIEANGILILVNIPNSISDNWPSDERPITVTGRLARNDYAQDFGKHPFVLESATWVDTPSESR
jgi:hypothetical protein